MYKITYLYVYLLSLKSIHSFIYPHYKYHVPLYQLYHSKNNMNENINHNNNHHDDKQPTKPIKLDKIEYTKENSDYLRLPLKPEMENQETIQVTKDAYTILKYHGSYQQYDRDLIKETKQKNWQFMLRLKNPAGEVPNNLYKLVDDLSTQYGINNIRLTTRQAVQIHGIIKGDLKQVIKEIMEIGSSTVGACGDVSRNVMCPPVPYDDKKEYYYANLYSKIIAQLFKPQTKAFSELWLEDEKVSTIEYWDKEINKENFNIPDIIYKQEGHNILTSDTTEPLYGDKYLPKKFKVGITVPGDNSIDIYTNDVGLVVIMDDTRENLLGFNVIVGGGMGRSHNKDITFARAGDHLGYVDKEDILLLMKAILATQRDHGNREIRANARMKYLVHQLGIDKFRELVEGYMGKKINTWKSLPEWELKDWMGWHLQQDENNKDNNDNNDNKNNKDNNKWFLGVNIPQGRIIDTEQIQYKKAFRQIIDTYLDVDTILTPSQSIIFKNIKTSQKKEIEEILKNHHIYLIEEVDMITRYSMACPALPLCGLAMTEAERYMPTLADIINQILIKYQLEDKKIVVRMTGCPNGCARPYMAELALVGDGNNSYQIWVGGSQNLERVGYIIKNKVTWGDELNQYLEQLIVSWKSSNTKQSFGDYWYRMKDI